MPLIAPFMRSSSRTFRVPDAITAPAYGYSMISSPLGGSCELKRQLARQASLCVRAKNGEVVRAIGLSARPKRLISRSIVFRAAQIGIINLFLGALNWEEKTWESSITGSP